MPGYHPKHVKEGFKHKHVPNPRKGEFTGKNKQNLSSHDEIAIPSKEDHNAPAKFKPLHFKKKWSSEKKALHEKEVHATHKLGAKHSNIAANIGKAAKSVKDEVVKAKEDLVEGFKAEQYKPQQYKKMDNLNGKSGQQAFKMYPGKHSEVNPGQFKGSEVEKYASLAHHPMKYPEAIQLQPGGDLQKPREETAKRKDTSDVKEALEKLAGNNAPLGYDQMKPMNFKPMDHKPKHYDTNKGSHSHPHS